MKNFQLLAKIVGYPLGKIQFLDFITWTKDLLSKTRSNAILRHFLTKKRIKMCLRKMCLTIFYKEID